MPDQLQCQEWESVGIREGDRTVDVRLLLEEG